MEKQFSEEHLFLMGNTLQTLGSTSQTYMLSTEWSQAGILKLGSNTTVTYNEYCPTGKSGQHTLTGCTNTAAAQIIYFFIEHYGLDLQLSLTVDDEYISTHQIEPLTIYINSATPGCISFDAINNKLADYDLNSADDAAALLYACGVIQQAKYGDSATSTPWGDEIFERAGLNSVFLPRVYWQRYSYWGSFDEATNQTNINEGAWEVIIDNLLSGKPVGGSLPGHAVIIDGYDAENDQFHLNYGWGGSQNGWYTRSEIIDKNFNEFVIDLSIVPEWSFTVDDSEYYGVGTLLRAVERSEAAAGANKIVFAHSVNNRTLSLDKSINIADDTCFDDFNMNVYITGAQDPSSSACMCFYTEKDVALGFNNFRGSLLCNSDRNNYAVYAADCSALNIQMTGGSIFAGSYADSGDYAAGTAALITDMENFTANKISSPSTALLDAIRNESSYSVYAGENNDSLKLSYRSLIAGNISMRSGNDSISLYGASRIYGNINMGSGTDSISIDSNSSITGAVSGLESLNIDLKAQINSDPLLTFTQSVLSFVNNVTITVNITQALMGTYTLIKDNSVYADNNYLQRLKVNIMGDNVSTHTLDSGASSSSAYAMLIYEDHSLKLLLKKGSFKDSAAPNMPGDPQVQVQGQNVTITWDHASDNNIVSGYMLRYGISADLTGSGSKFTTNIAEFSNLVNGKYYFQLRSVDASNNYSDWTEVRSFVVENKYVNDLKGTAENLCWQALSNVNGYIIDYTTDDFKNVISFETAGTQIDTHALPQGDYTWRIKTLTGNFISYGSSISAAAAGDTPSVYTSDADSNLDVFFARANGVWSDLYAARHNGSTNNWNGTGEQVMLTGKNRISDVFNGSSDASVLLLTDDNNGDALFMDDIYTSFGKDAARLTEIDEIRAGAGDDIIDLTSQLFAYQGNGVTVHGGNGNDVIWANSGENILFGDYGNDSITGGSGNDIIAGGAGNDTLHGGGGNDIFTFNYFFGTDTVTQLAGGTVTLWFEDGSPDKWNASEMTYTDGSNQVKVYGIEAEDVTLKFSGDTSAMPEGIFNIATSEKIMENEYKGLLA